MRNKCTAPVAPAPPPPPPPPPALPQSPTDDGTAQAAEPVPELRLSHNATPWERFSRKEAFLKEAPEAAHALAEPQAGYPPPDRPVEASWDPVASGPLVDVHTDCSHKDTSDAELVTERNDAQARPDVEDAEPPPPPPPGVPAGQLSNGADAGSSSSSSYSSNPGDEALKPESLVRRQQDFAELCRPWGETTVDKGWEEPWPLLGKADGMVVGIDGAMVDADVAGGPPSASGIPDKVDSDSPSQGFRGPPGLEELQRSTSPQPNGDTVGSNGSAAAEASESSNDKDSEANAKPPPDCRWAFAEVAREAVEKAEAQAHAGGQLQFQ